jgi:hypothetical protein
MIDILILVFETTLYKIVKSLEEGDNTVVTLTWGRHHELSPTTWPALDQWNWLYYSEGIIIYMTWAFYLTSQCIFTRENFDVSCINWVTCIFIFFIFIFTILLTLFSFLKVHVMVMLLSKLYIEIVFYRFIKMYCNIGPVYIEDKSLKLTLKRSKMMIYTHIFLKIELLGVRSTGIYTF